jgi:CheY-like chemotaxis protein
MATILYVEDHPPAQLLMRAIVSEMTPHTLVVANSSAEAVKVAAEKHPALYILDLDLPDGDGLSLARTLNTVHPAPVIIVSAYAEAVDPDSLDYLYLSKPLDPDDVARAIQRTLA